MSLILEALKKSEAQRRLGKAPGLGTPFSARRRRRSPLPWFLLAIAIVAAGGWWWLRSQPAAVDGNAANDAATRPIGASANAAAGTAAARARRLTAEPAARPVVPKPLPAATGTPPPLAPATAVVATAARTAPPSVPPPAAPAPNSIAANAPTPAPTSTPVVAHNATMAAPPAVATTTNPVAPPPTRAPADAPAVPSIDDMPYGLRKELPDISISMQVYSADAARRFVVVDGERKVEGDTIKDAVALREIRANGVVLEFHGQRFFIPRPGS